MNVIKRDGSVVQYDRMKIVIALTKANDAVEENEKATHSQIDAIADYITNKQKTRILVEDIQDMVEFKLMEIGKFALAKAYIIYRYNRAMVRKANTTDDSILSLIKNSNKDVMEENSNKDAAPLLACGRGTFAGLFNQIQLAKGLYDRLIEQYGKRGIHTGFCKVERQEGRKEHSCDYLTGDLHVKRSDEPIPQKHNENHRGGSKQQA